MDASVNRIPSSKDERTLLISVKMRESRPEEIEYSLDELRLLVETAGAVIVSSRIVKRDSIDPAFILGKGYLDELSDYITDNEIKLIVFDMNNIRPAQVRNLEEKLKCRVVGRNEVIMDIFARRAKSTESKIEVELAQLRYILPRLKGLGGVLSRLGGGIGTRGPGETMLETDRRHIQNRISKLKNKLTKYKSHRELTSQTLNKSPASGTILFEYVCRPCIKTGSIITICPYNCIIAVYRYRIAKAVIFRNILW